ncbi:MAG: aminoacetone oxidase family FAD-binding enzyme [Bacteroidales bacterium]|nr:aminoacetone oxidase family FAD-binding enzyme [Bacteroidales bacterium]
MAIIGGGAAGCFCAVEIKRRNPAAAVTVYEAGAKALAKVAVTGGGRCNISNTFDSVGSLAEVYPRGEKLVRQAFRVFSPEDTRRWWEAEGVRIVEEPVRSSGDQTGRLFPASHDAMQVVRTLERLMRQLGVEVRCNAKVVAIRHEALSDTTNPSPSHGYSLSFQDGHSEYADRVVVTTGGGALNLLEGLGIEIVPPVPSLFTFKLADQGIRELTGTTVDNVTLALAGTKFRSHGTLLLTDWGVSGPATLRLSSFAARHLADSSYRANLLIGWLSLPEAEVRSLLAALSTQNPSSANSVNRASMQSGNGPSGFSSSKMVANTPPAGISSRLWHHLLRRAGLREDIRWAELGSKGLNRLVAVLTADSYEITGRAKFKEEFVTAGGVSMSAVNPSTLESRQHPGLFFAGEVLDIDALTGGFNLQSAWSTAYLVARHI